MIFVFHREKEIKDFFKYEDSEIDDENIRRKFANVSVTFGVILSKN